MSDARPSGSPAGLLLVVLGLWVLGQTIVGGLVGRLLALSGSSNPSDSSPAPLPVGGATFSPAQDAQAISTVVGGVLKPGGGGPTSATAAAGPAGSAHPAPGVPIQGGLLPVLQQVAGS